MENPTQSHDQYVTDRDRRPSRWKVSLTWAALVLLGFLIFELTAQPALSLLVVCAKFGWDDSLTAFWLRRKDPIRPRGAACAWIYLAFGVLKCSEAGLGLTLLLILLGGIAGMKPGQPGNRELGIQIFVTIGIFLGGMWLAALFASLGLRMAKKHEFKIWLSSAVRLARRNDFWPPLLGRKNKVGSLEVSFFVPSFLAFTGGVVAVSLLWANNPLVAAVFGVMAIIAGLPVWIVWPFLLRHYPVMFSRSLQPLFAATPEECWPSEKADEQDSAA